VRSTSHAAYRAVFRTLITPFLVVQNWRSVLTLAQAAVLRWCERTSFTPLWNNRHAYSCVLSIL